MQIFKNTSFDFLGKKWPFIIASVTLTVAGVVSILVKGGLRYGIDFRGGAEMTVRFAGPPPVQKIRSAMTQRIRGEITVQGVGGGRNEVLIGTEMKSDQELAAARASMMEALEATFGQAGKLDLNNTGHDALINRLRDGLTRAGAGMPDQQIHEVVNRLLDSRDVDHSGLFTSFNEVASVPGVTPAVRTALEQETYLSPYHVRGVEVVGPRVGNELKRQALLATLYALGGMLVYIAFRFEWIYGVAAVVAVFHDTIITIGLFSIFNKEISLTVIAALLTLVGYSMNDTIVIFDRIRENLKVSRRESLEALINRSVNQTLSRTILTSGLTFLTVLSLFLFGGDVLHGFAFALVIGIIIGTYSSIFIASPILVFWKDFSESRKKRTIPAAPVSTPVDAGRRGIKAMK